jgi:glycosyltransferase involved in cell wall biosynthesis
VFVKVYVLSPSATAAPNREVSGVEDGVYFEYLTGMVTWPEGVSLIRKIGHFLYGLWRLPWEMRKDDITCVIYYGSYWPVYLLLRLITKALSASLVADKSEFPKGYQRMGRIRQAWTRIALKSFDGFIVMTNELSRFYTHAKAAKAKVFLLPMTLDVGRFANIERVQPIRRYIACVFGVHNRDCVSDTVEAFHRYCCAVGSEAYHLWLIGDFIRLPEAERIRAFISANALSEHVIIKGVLPIQDVPRVLVDAECVMTTAREYASGGFPAKLVEYLASGTPIVATAAGAVGGYLRDGEHAYLARPGDISEIAAALVRCHRESGASWQMGEAAKRLASQVFSADPYADDLLQFCESL